MKSFDYVIVNERGMDPRYAGLLVRAAKSYRSEIVISKAGNSAKARNLMRIVGLCFKQGDTVAVEGDDEAAAAVEMEAIFKENL